MKTSASWFQYPSFQWTQQQATVIGGGLAGAQMAWHLCQAGWKVTLIERHKSLASEASGNLAGVISPKMTAQQSIGETFYTEAFHYTLAQLEQLKQQGHAIDMDDCGVLQLAHNPREKARWKALKERQLPTDFIQLLDEHETEAIAGISLHPDKKYCACYFPRGGWIKPKSLVNALVNHPNCQLVYQSEVLKLKKEDKQWEILSHNKLIAKSEVVIIANGKDLRQFEQSCFLPAMPVAGQTSTSLASDFSAQLNTVIGHEGYLTPSLYAQNFEQSQTRETQQKTHVFGATFERDQSQAHLQADADQQNFDCLQRYLPEFANSLNKVQSGHVAVRMTTPDRFPYVGALPDEDFYQKHYDDLHFGKKWKEYPQAEYQNGLFVLGGLGSRGIITSGICAKALSELLQNRQKTTQTQQLLKNCHPARFIIKNLKRQQATPTRF